MIWPFALMISENCFCVHLIFVHLAFGLGSQNGTVDRFALHLQQILSVDCHPLNPKSHLNHGQSPLHCSKHALKCNSPVLLARLLSRGSHGSWLWRFDGHTPINRTVTLHTKTSKIASSVHRPPQPQSQTFCFSTHLKMCRLEPSQEQTFHDITSMFMPLFSSMPSPWIPIVIKGSSGRLYVREKSFFILAKPDFGSKLMCCKIVFPNANTK